MPVGAKEEKGYFMGNLVKSLYQKTTSFSLALVLVLSNFVAMVPLAPQIAGAVSYDFEPDLNPTLDLDTYFVNSSYKGIGVDIGVDELVDATAVEVKVERQNGDPVIKTNKVTGNVLNLLNTGTPTQVTAPIVIQQGTYDEAGSSSWNQPSETWNSTNTPTSITVTIFRGAKSPLVKTVNFAGISTNLATLSDVMPLDTSAPAISNISIDPQINGNTGGNTVTVYFDMTDETGINFDASFVMFADGPNTPNQLKESIKVKPVHISGNSYKAEFNSLQFVKANFVGRYNLQFTRVDTLGNRTSSKPVEFRNILVDNSGPTSILITPADGSIVNGIVRFEFEVSDDTGVASGYVKLNGPTTKQANLTHDTGDIWYADIDTSELTDGTYTVDARFVDVFGRARYGANKGSVIVDSTIPTTPTITKPGIRTWHKTAPILNEWTAASDDNGVSHYQIAYNYADGHAFGGGNTCPGVVIPGATGFVACRDVNGLSRNHAPTLTEQGKVTIWVRAIDNAGNAGAWSTPVYYYYDHEAPVTDINVSEVASQKFTVSGHAADNEQLNRVYVQLVHRETSTRYGGTTINLIPEGKEADWSVEYNIADLPEGTYAAHVSVVDMAGNTSSAGWTDNFFVDNTAPEAPSLVSPTNGAVVKGASLTNEWSAVADAVSYVYESYHDEAATNLRWNESFTATNKTATNVADTTFWWRVKAIDEAGNVGEWSDLWKVVVDNTAPSVEFTNPTSTTLFNSDVEVRATIADANLRHYWVQVKKNGTTIYSQTILSSGITNEPVYTATEDGDYIITIAARDLAGGTSTSGNRSEDVVKSFTIDKTAPILTVLAPLANTEFLPTEDIDIETFVGDNRKISSVSIVIEGQAGTFQIDEDFDTDNGGSSFFTIAAGTLPVGEYNLIATAIDEGGNITEVYTTLFVVEPEEETPGEEEGENNEENETDNTDNTDEDGQGGSPQQNNGSSSNNNSGSTANPTDNNSATPTNTNNQVAQNTTNNQAPDETGNNDNEEEQSVDTPQDAEDTEGNEENNQDIAGARDEEEQSGILAWYWWLAILAALAGGWWFIFGRRKKDEEEKQA